MSGAKANKKKSDRKIRDVVKQLKKEFSAEQLSLLSDSALAKHLARFDLGGDRSRRGYVKRARKLQLIPGRREM